MNLFRALGATIFAAGIVLLVFGIISTQKVGEEITSSVTGHYTDATLWYIIGGIALMIAGVGITRVKR